jgi:hypothetical protein
MPIVQIAARQMLGEQMPHLLADPELTLRRCRVGSLSGHDVCLR